MKTIRQHYVVFPVNTSDLTLRGLGVHERHRGRVRRPHGIAFYLLVYFYTAASIRTAAGEVFLPPGTFIVWKPGTPHDFGSEAECDHTWLLVSGRMLARQLATNRIRCNVPLALPLAPVLEHALLAIHHEVSTHAPANAGYVKNLLHNALIDLGREIQASGGAQQVPAEYLHVRSYLEEHFAEPVTLRQLAGLVHRSVPRFASRFRALFGFTPIDYQIRLRLQHASVLLHDCNWSITQIAREVGYPSLQYFSRSFRQRFGVSPQEARRRLQGAARLAIKTGNQ
jgi:AraC-like DNA-binding protein